MKIFVGVLYIQASTCPPRPLPEAMVHYARQDTRHMGYLYSRYGQIQKLET